MPPKTVLVVDDEKDLVDLVGFNLEKEGFSVLKALDGEKALDLVRTKRPDLVVLDLMLPGVKGLDVCRILRGRPETAALPIIMLTARGEEVDKIVGLEMGADDYVTKPFSIRELMARIRTVLRRSALRNEPPAGKVFEARGLRIDYDAYEVTVSGRPVDIGPTELKLLMFLSRNPGRVYSGTSFWIASGATRPLWNRAPSMSTSAASGPPSRRTRKTPPTSSPSGGWATSSPTSNRATVPGSFPRGSGGLGLRMSR
jgi:DNA-binding response OmpR family regulator